MADQLFNASSGFWDAQNGDRVYSADDMNKPYKRLVCDGVFATPEGTPSTDFQVTAAAGRNLTIHAGEGIFAGKWVHSDAQAVEAPANNSAYPRIDSVLMQVDTRATGRKAVVVYRTGTAAQSPTPPAINQTTGVAEYRLANITVTAGASVVLQSQISDRRGIDTPWVSALIQQVDTSTLMEQYTAALQEYMAEQEVQFQNYTAEQRESWEEFVNTLTKDLSVSMNLSEQKEDITTVSEVASIPLPFQEYDPFNDVLQVYINGLLALEGTDYTYSNGEIVLAENLGTGQTVSFRMFKALIGGNLSDTTTLIERLDNKVDAFMRDSGWQGLTLAAGFSVVDSQTPSVRKVGGKIYLKGAIKGTWTAGNKVADLPYGFSPAYTYRFTSSGTSGTIGFKVEDNKLYCESKVGAVGSSVTIGLTASWLSAYSTTEMVFKYKGTVTYYSALPQNPDAGDVYMVLTTNTGAHVDAGDCVVWNGESWEVMQSSIPEYQITDVIDTIS